MDDQKSVEPRWLSESRRRIAESQIAMRVGSDIHLLEMAVAAYQKLAALPAAALAAALAAVPREPTPEMLDKGAMEIAMNHQRVQTAESAARCVYRAMLAAAPDAPAAVPTNPDAGILEIHRLERARMRVTDEMVSRFLCWKLPENFNPDGGITFKKTFNDGTPYQMNREPSGTNLLDADQARAMLEHVLASPAAQPVEPSTAPKVESDVLDAAPVVRWLLEYSFNGDEVGSAIYESDSECRRSAQSDGGVCEPLIRLRDARAAMKEHRP